MHARWAKLEKVLCLWRGVNYTAFNCRISSIKMANLTSARSQTFTIVSNMICYTTGIVSNHYSS